MPRELIKSHKGDKRYVRRKKSKFTTLPIDVLHSLAQTVAPTKIAPPSSDKDRHEKPGLTAKF